MAAVRSSEKVLVCETCGDEGFKNAFVYCIKCLDFAIHRYCLRVIPETSNELVNWCCEDCKVRSSKSQEKEPEIVTGQIEAIHLKKKQKKRESIACIIAGSKVVNCQENVKDHRCEYIDIKKWLFPYHVPKKNRSSRKKITACLVAKSKEDKLPCVLMADSIKHSLDAKKMIAACEHGKSISDSSSMEIELDKTTNHELQDETGSNVSRSAVLDSRLQDNCNRHAQALAAPVWRGKRNNPTSEHPPIDVKRMPTRMKALDVVSPQSPLSNNGMMAAAQPYPDLALISPDNYLPLKQNNPHIDLQTFKTKQFPVLIEILKNHLIAYALSAHPTIPLLYLQQVWNTIEYHEEDNAPYFQFSIYQFTIKLNMNQFRHILRVPKANSFPSKIDFDDFPATEAEVLAEIQSLGYDGELKKLSQYKRNNNQAGLSCFPF